MITHDEDLARRMIDLKANTLNTTSKDMKVLFIKGISSSFIDCFGDWEDIFQSNVIQHRVQQKPRSQTQPPVQKPIITLNPSNRPVVTSETHLTVSHFPRIGDTVISKSNGSMQLIGEIGDGGEGKVYETNRGQACKIYHEKMLTQERHDKLSIMLSNPINKPEIIWPEYLIYNTNREFVGYAMENVPGDTLDNFIDKKEILQQFPSWKRIDLVVIALNIVQKIASLHQLKIIIGDINLKNIMLKNEKELFLIDTDSYQIENYPSPVGKEEFTPPENQKKVFTQFLRTFDQEYFSVATLLFLILLLGKNPYAKKGGGTIIENIKAMDFPYSLDINTCYKAPAGPWLYYWSHLPFEIKDAFYDVFRNNIRKSAQEWVDLLKRYRDNIISGSASNEIFPAFIFRDLTQQVNCDSCGTILRKGGGYTLQLKAKQSVFLCPKCGLLFKQQALGQGGKVSHKQIKGSFHNQFFNSSNSGLLKKLFNP